MWAQQRVDIVSFGETYMRQLGVELTFWLDICLAGANKVPDYDSR